jgi:hypothetical protein
MPAGGFIDSCPFRAKLAHFPAGSNYYNINLENLDGVN